MNAPIAATSPHAGWRHAVFGRNALLMVALLLIGLVFQYFTRDARNSFLTARSVATVFTQASVIGVLACGMTFLIILRHIDLSVGSAIAFLGALAAWMMAPLPTPAAEDPFGLGAAGLGAAGEVSGLGWSPLPVFLCVLGLGIVLWGLKGLLQANTGMPAFIITLGGFMGYRGLAYLTCPREIPLSPGGVINAIGTENIPTSLGWSIVAAAVLFAIFQTVRARAARGGPWLLAAVPGLLSAGVAVFLMQYRGIAWLTFLWVVIAVAMNFVATQTVFGRHLFAVGGNAEAARLCGIRVKFVNVCAFALMGALVALAALMYLGQQGTAESSAGNLAELDAIAACVLGGVSLQGGKGSILGCVLGALIMQSLTLGLYQCNVQPGWEMIIKAGVLVAVVAFDHLLRRE